MYYIVQFNSPSANATKIWITRSGKCLMQNNNSHIPDRELRYMIKIIEARSADVIAKWKESFWYCKLLLLIKLFEEGF